MLLPRLLAGTLSLAVAAHAAVTNTTADTQAADIQGGDVAKYPPVCPQVTVIKPAVTVTFTQPAGSYVKPTVTVTSTLTKPEGAVTVTTTKTTGGDYGGTTYAFPGAVTYPPLTCSEKR